MNFGFRILKKLLSFRLLKIFGEKLSAEYENVQPFQQKLQEIIKSMNMLEV